MTERLRKFLAAPFGGSLRKDVTTATGLSTPQAGLTHYDRKKAVEKAVLELSMQKGGPGSGPHPGGGKEKPQYEHSYRPEGYTDSPESKAWEKEREGKIKAGHGIDYKYDVEQTSRVEEVRRGRSGPEYKVTPTEGGYAQGASIWVHHDEIMGHHYPKS